MKKLAYQIKGPPWRHALGVRGWSKAPITGLSRPGPVRASALLPQGKTIASERRCLTPAHRGEKLVDTLLRLRWDYGVSRVGKVTKSEAFLCSLRSWYSPVAEVPREGRAGPWKPEIDVLLQSLAPL